MIPSDRRRFLQNATGIAAVVGLPLRTQAQGPATFPRHPLRIIDAFSAGGITDTLARMLASIATTGLKQPIVVENRPGAGGGVAAAFVLQGPSDGHSLLMAAVSHSYSSALIPTIGFDLSRDFAPICGVASGPLVIVVRADSPWRSFDDLVKAGRSSEPLAYGSGGVGTLTHLVPELLAQQLRLKLTHVSYRGTAPAIQDLMGGQIAFVADTSQTAVAQISGGRLRALAVTSATRLPQLPQVPTLAEAALGGFQAQSWYGLVAPSGTPADSLAILRSSFAAAVTARSFQQQIRELSSTPMPLPPAEFGRLILTEKQRWSELVRKLDIRVS